MSLQPTPLPLPVRTADDAMQLLSLAVEQPLQAETHAFLLDADGIGGVLVVIGETHPPEAVLDVVELMASVGEGVPGMVALVVATVRPDGKVEPDDVDLWLEASHLARHHGIELLEWFVLGPRGFDTPRSLTCEPERWPVKA